MLRLPTILLCICMFFPSPFKVTVDATCSQLGANMIADFEFKLTQTNLPHIDQDFLIVRPYGAFWLSNNTVWLQELHLHIFTRKPHFPYKLWTSQMYTVSTTTWSWRSPIFNMHQVRFSLDVLIPLFCFLDMWPSGHLATTSESLRAPNGAGKDSFNHLPSLYCLFPRVE